MRRAWKSSSPSGAGVASNRFTVCLIAGRPSCGERVISVLSFVLFCRQCELGIIGADRRFKAESGFLAARRSTDAGKIDFARIVKISLNTLRLVRNQGHWRRLLDYCFDWRWRSLRWFRLWQVFAQPLFGLLVPLSVRAVDLVGRKWGRTGHAFQFQLDHFQFWFLIFLN